MISVLKLSELWFDTKGVTFVLAQQSTSYKELNEASNHCDNSYNSRSLTQHLLLT
jgi:hypothetical protein